MFEIILFLVVGSIIYSVVQSVRRGDVGPEERKQNPTLLESVSELAEEAARNASKYRSQTEFELTYCEWFRRFEITVSKALEFAEDKAKRESELNADPQLRKLFDEIIQNYPAQAEKSKSKIDSSWAHEGPPPEPPSNSDPELDALFRRIYWDRNERHKKFVQDVRDKLTRKPDCREFFTKYLRDLNLRNILSRYFLADDVLRRVAAAPRNSAARDIASEALNMARSVDDPNQRTRALLKVAEGQAQIGDLSSARVTIAEALEAAQEDPSEWLSQLDKVAKVQISLGDVSEALETANRIVDPSSQGKVLVEISNVQASLGDMSGAQITALAALREARKIAPAEDRCRALREVAIALAKAEDGPTARIAIDEALGATQEIEESKRTVLIRYSRPARAEAMGDVAKVQAAIGDISGAVRTARSIEDQGQNQKVLVKLVETLAQAGDVSRAQEIARSIEVAGERCWALAYVATAQAELGDLSAARDTASEALETARGIEYRSTSLRALVQIAEKLAYAGDVLGALEIARSARDAETSCRALASVAFALARTGDQSGAKHTASEALVTARRVDPIDSIPGALGQVARAHAEAGDSPKALLIARGIGSVAHRSYVLTEIARTQLKVGDKTGAKSTTYEALEAARSPHGGLQYLSCESFCRVAELQVMIGDTGARQTALGAGNAVQVAYALERVAKANAEAGHLVQAIEIALGIEDVEKRSSATISVAVAYNLRNKHAALKCDDTAERADRQPNRRPATSWPSDATNDSKYQPLQTSTGDGPKGQPDKDAIERIVQARKIRHLVFPI